MLSRAHSCKCDEMGMRSLAVWTVVVYDQSGKDTRQVLIIQLVIVVASDRTRLKSLTRR